MIIIESTKTINGILFVMLVHTPTNSAYEIVFETVSAAQCYVNILNDRDAKIEIN